jgi:hypothetical protein
VLTHRGESSGHVDRFHSQNHHIGTLDSPFDDIDLEWVSLREVRRSLC